ncbi:CidA/LrgA family protein [Fusobacterium massiliense]|jgi:murein hydrolase exporter|uniref:CidA/LrgA family protein n=1 Tax=Fusobacterium massiliense TaxID=1852365 RepID=UPI0009400F3B|nr:CidA/LrgA family protein [Fusobacterium massiliense]
MLREFIIIFIINYIGTIISKTLALPIPGTIIGLLLLFVLLYYKIIKLNMIENVANFLLANMTIFFMPPTVKIMDSYQLLQGNFIKFVVLIIVSTVITMGVTGKVVQFMIEHLERKEKKKNERDINQ